MRFLSTILLAGLLTSPSLADTLFMFPSTSNISISGASTAEFGFGNNRPADWIWIRSHCNDLSFGIVKPRTSYPIRLAASQEFEASVHVVTVGVSNESTGTCTFSLQGAHH